jgi:hypothetical protein
MASRQYWSRIACQRPDGYCQSDDRENRGLVDMLYGPDLMRLATTIEPVLGRRLAERGCIPSREVGVRVCLGIRFDVIHRRPIFWVAPDVVRVAWLIHTHVINKHRRRERQLRKVKVRGETW